MSFNPKTQYDIYPDKIPIRHFHAYKELYVTRPPYQRKSVWGPKKKRDLMDSLFRRYYIPKLVIREVRLSDSKTVEEVIDGQQRINTVQDFFNNDFKLPKSLADLKSDLPGKTYDKLSPEMRLFLDEQVKFDIDRIKGIDDPKNRDHQKIATEIFWRLQQGEALNFMEKAHAKLASLSRNFVVKYSDDISFDFDEYIPIDSNKFKHKFFNIVDRDNNRMQNLMLMSRLAMIEEANGYVELKDTALTQFIENHEIPEGVDNYTYENEDSAKKVISNLTFLYEMFKDDTIIDAANGVKELKREYLIISLYMLVRHIRKFYVITEEIKTAIYYYFLNFHERWRKGDPEDIDIVVFTSNRQQSFLNIQMRDMVFRQLFFEYLIDKNIEILSKDSKRAFSEAQRIKIYRRDKGLCQQCLADEKPEKECQVSWSQYQADHVNPHAKGGVTEVENGQVLCTLHNQSKGAKII
ncbi:MAG: HNH endonuclease family protein [Candidatus Scalindua sp.]